MIYAEDRDSSVVLVSGLSGSGKSTFLKLLQDGKISAEILERLPKGCETWRIVSSNGLRTSGGDVDISKSILHYDTVFAYRMRIDDYAEDPPLKALEAVDVFTIVTLELSREQLIAQFNHRFEGKMQKKAFVRRFWRRHLHLPVRRTLAYFGVTSMLRDTEDLYSDPNWLIERSLKWETYIRSLASAKSAVRIVRIRPVLDDVGCPDFQLEHELGESGFGRVCGD